MNNFDEMEAKLEEMFDKADNLMISQKKYEEAVSNALFLFSFSSMNID